MITTKAVSNLELGNNVSDRVTIRSTSWLVHKKSAAVPHNPGQARTHSSV
jgi:hypothetical protein